MLLMDNTILGCPFFKKEYLYKIHLLGFFLLENKDETGHLTACDLYFKSRNDYYRIRADLLRFTDKHKSDKMSLKIDSLKEFQYFRCPKTVIIHDTATSQPRLQELTYYIFPEKQEIIFDNIMINDLDNFIIQSDIFSFSLIKGCGYMDFDLSNAKPCNRDDFINANFSGKEKDDIMEILIDNDKFQQQCYENDLKKGVYNDEQSR